MSRMPIFLSNCESRPHSTFYPPDGDKVAFYDLDRRGAHARKMVGLSRGTECIVATPQGLHDIRFDWYALSHEAVRPAPEGCDVRVFYGTALKSVVLPKDTAVATEPYAMFFLAGGGFKRGSVIAETP